MSKMQLITPTTPVDTLADIVRPVDGTLADGMTEHPAVPEVILDEDDLQVGAPGTETSAEALAVTIQWVWESHTHGPRTLGCTIIQTVIGGRQSGEGWAEATQWVSPGILTADQARTIAILGLDGTMPRRAGWAEL